MCALSITAACGVLRSPTSDPIVELHTSCALWLMNTQDMFAVHASGALAHHEQIDSIESNSGSAWV